MKGDVGMSPHEKEGEQEDAYIKTESHSTPSSCLPSFSRRGGEIGGGGGEGGRGGAWALPNFSMGEPSPPAFADHEQLNFPLLGPFLCPRARPSPSLFL